MPEKYKTTLELLDAIGRTITATLEQEGLLLPGTVDDLMRAKDCVNQLKGREVRRIE
jgi:hypothetical protein